VLHRKLLKLVLSLLLLGENNVTNVQIVGVCSVIKIAFCHHLSLSYNAGGEKWLINTAKALAKKHTVEIYALPFLLDGKPRINPNESLDGIYYREGFNHNVKADVTYVTYNPLSFLNFNISGPKIAGIHSEAYWQKPNIHYGKFPLVANIVNRFTSYFELRRFNAVHTILNGLYPINHPKIFSIPNYVDSEIYHPYKKSDEFTVTFASRKVWQKGFDIFSQVAKQLDCSVKVSGDIAEEVMPEFLGSSSVVVAPSRVDTFGLVLVESLLTGTPVVTSPLPSHYSLGLPLKYARTVEEYLQEINFVKKDPVSLDYRSFAMKYDKKQIIKKFEEMLIQVAHS
jgi:glycosyltransferase involved in cell wall biosynthesis